MTEAAPAREQPSEFETRDFYLACFLRCTGYKLLNLRAVGHRRVFVFKDRPERRNDVITLYGGILAEWSKAEAATAGEWYPPSTDRSSTGEVRHES